MWVYELAVPRLSRDTPEGIEVLTVAAYSGFERGKNNPVLQREKGIGPIPTGSYLIGEAYDSDTHGPVVMHLIPTPQVATYGRNGFLIHGDSKLVPGAASHGCIILPRPVRERIAASPDRLLVVITGGI